jgi:hypothetical protein
LPTKRKVLRVLHCPSRATVPLPLTRMLYRMPHVSSKANKAASAKPRSAVSRTRGGATADPGKFESERLCSYKRGATWDVYIFVVFYSGDQPHADPQTALSR